MKSVSELSGVRVPNCDQSIIGDQKVTDYLLNSEHVHGKSKAKFFLGRGFTKENIDEFKNALMRHAIERDVFEKPATEFGEKYIVKCELTTPDLRNPCIITVWIIENGQEVPKLVTAYPTT
jgi:hypothetical protein